MSSLKKILYYASERVLGLFRNITAEIPECVSMLVAISWAIPFTFNPQIVGYSLFLTKLTEVIPPAVLATICWVLFVYQFVGCVLGGRPSHFLVEGSYKVAERWFRARQVGLWLSLFLWSAMAYLVSRSGYVTVGTCLHSGVAVVCFAGIIRLQEAIVTERKSAGMKSLRGDRDALRSGEEKAWTRYSSTLRPSGRSSSQ